MGKRIGPKRPVRSLCFYEGDDISMNEEKKIMTDAAYENAINLKLFSALLSMAASASDEDNAALKFSRMEDSLPWESRRKEIGDFFAPHGLRYVGEVLERFEEHFGSGAENFRAVALAFGLRRALSAVQCVYWTAEGKLSEKTRT